MPRPLNLVVHSLVAVSVVAFGAAAEAAEGAGSNYPGGVENYFTGAAPPPGLHLLAYGEYLSADREKDNSGNDLPLPPDFKVRAAAVVARGIWVMPYTLLGGNPLLEVIVPIVDLKVTAGGHSQTKNGVGEVFVGAGIAYHHSPSLHSAIALDVILPTGPYSPTALANISRNYVTYEPIYSVSLINPSGFSADFKAVANFNETNDATHYKSGDEVFVDYDAGWGVGGGWVVGVGGFVRKQFTDDRINGNSIPGSRARVFSIGPSVAYSNGKGWLITAKYEADTGVRNALQGSTFWIKTVVPF